MIVEVTSKPKLQQMLRFCLGNEETSLKWEFPGKGKTDIIVDGEKPFTVFFFNNFTFIDKTHITVTKFKTKRKYTTILQIGSKLHKDEKE